MEINVRDNQGVVVFDIAGEVDIYNAHEIEENAKKYIEEGKKNFIFNFEKVTYIDSIGIRILIICYSRLRKVEGSLRIISLDKFVRKIFDLTKMSSFFKIFDTEEEAMQGLP